jgi:PTH1 family peptidyl-tRNA hydrolase
MVRLVVGLGNPGKEYEATRHNVGWQVLDRVAKELSFTFSRAKFNAVYGEFLSEHGKVLFLKPTTYMNRSGESVAQFVKFFKVKPSDVLLVYDDLDLPLGAVRLRLKGSSGGHRGVESVIKALGTKDFPRLRVGIGRPERKEDVVNYVLSPFKREELSTLEPALKKAADCIVEIVKRGKVDQKLISKCK